MVVFVASECNRAKVVVFGQSGFTRSKLIVFVQTACMWARWL